MCLSLWKMKAPLNRPRQADTQYTLTSALRVLGEEFILVNSVVICKHCVWTQSSKSS